LVAESVVFDASRFAGVGSACRRGRDGVGGAPGDPAHLAGGFQLQGPGELARVDLVQDRVVASVHVAGVEFRAAEVEGTELLQEIAEAAGLRKAPL
jgi:hypothetical protein